MNYSIIPVVDTTDNQVLQRKLQECSNKYDIPYRHLYWGHMTLYRVPNLMTNVQTSK
jgi:hypothetical protein